MLDTLKTLLDKTERELWLEEKRIVDGIDEACRTHTSLQQNYWEKAHALRSRRDAILRMIEAVDVASPHA